jgi:hypothetical protein
VDNVAQRVGPHTLIIHDINTSSGEADEIESLALLRPLFRRFNCRLVFVKPGVVLAVFVDHISLKDCSETMGGGMRNKFRLRCPE